MKTKLLEVDQVAAVRQQRWLFEPISVRVESGQWIQIQGANGVGKSTFIRILAGLYPRRKGRIFFNGTSISQVGSAGHQVFYLGHQNFLNPDLTVAENLSLFINLHNLDKISGLREALETFDIIDLEMRLVKFLSFGQRQRVALSCATLHPGWLWLLDEPLVGLDQYTVQCFSQALTSHLAKGGGAVIATHQILPNIEPNYTLLLHAFTGEEAW